MTTLAESISRPKPVSEQVQDLLRSRILQGRYALEERMPSEDRLAQELNVSRATVRTALAALAAEGLVRRRHGDGTYPTQNTLEVTVRARTAWNIERQIEQSGRAPSIQVLENGQRPATLQEATRLSLEPGEPVFAIRRLFLADGEPVMVADHILRAQTIPPDALPEAARMPLLEFLGRHFPLPLQAGAVLFKAVPAQADTAAFLQVETGSPLLLLESTLQDDTGRALLTAWEYYRGEEGFLLPVAPIQS